MSKMAHFLGQLEKSQKLTNFTGIMQLITEWNNSYNHARVNLCPKKENENEAKYFEK